MLNKTTSLWSYIHLINKNDSSTFWYLAVSSIPSYQPRLEANKSKSCAQIKDNQEMPSEELHKVTYNEGKRVGVIES